MLQKQLRKFVVSMIKQLFTKCQVHNWFLKFHSGNTSMRIEPRPRCSSKLDQDTLRKLVECNPCKVT